MARPGAAAGRNRPVPRRVAETGIEPVVAHNSYLINIAAAALALREQSLAALVEEFDRAEALGLYGLVMHPGSFTTGSEQEGLRLIARAFARAARHGRAHALILLEHTAGQGTNLGHRFEHLATILELVDGSPRVGVCLDTCHLLAAGYDICSEEGYAGLSRQFDRLVGLDRLKAFHLNDSKKPCGSRVDRHEHIGKGCLGLEPFRRLRNDPRFARLPMLLETPKLDTPESRRKSDADPWDMRNLRTLRRLMREGE